MKQPSILIVEDEAIIALDLKRSLADLGFVVADICASGEAAVQAAQDLQPDLALIDVHLNGVLDGIQAAAIIQTRANIPILFLTAFADEDTLSRVAKSAAFGYILKPFEKRELIANIEMALYKHRMDTELRRTKDELERRLQELGRAEARLRKSEALLRATFESSPDAVVIVDREYRYLFVNQAAIDLVGITWEQVEGKSAREGLAHIPELMQLFLRRVDHSFATGQPFVLEDALTLAGRPFYGETVFMPVLDERGQMFAVANVYRDITARKQAELALAESESLYRLLLEASPESIILTDVNGKVVLCNRVAAELHGFDAVEDLVGMIGFDLIAPEEHARAQQVIETALAEDGARGIEFTAIGRDGRRSPAETSVSLLRDEHDRVTHYLWVGHDISRRKAAEAEILRQNRQLEALRKIGLELTAELDPGKLLKTIVNSAVNLIGGVFGGLYLYRPELDAIQLSMATGPRSLPIGAILKRGEGLSGKVWETLRPMAVDDYAQWDGKAEIFAHVEDCSILAAPIVDGDHFLGVVNISTLAPYHFSSQAQELLALFASQAAVAIRNAQFVEQQRAQRRRADALARVASCANTSVDTQTMLSVLCEETARALNATAAHIRFYDASAGTLDYALGYQAMPLGPAYQASLPAERFASAFHGHRLPVVIQDYRPDLGAPTMASGSPMTLACAGIFFEQEVIGALNVFTIGERCYSQDELTFLQAMTEQAGVIIDRERWQDRSRRQLHRLESLHRLTTTLREARNSREIIPILTENAIRAAGAAAGAYLLPAPAATALGDDPVCRRFVRPPQGDVNERAWEICLPGTVLEGLFHAARLLPLPELAANGAAALCAALPADFQACTALALLPLQASETLLGVLLLGFDRSEALNVEEQRLLDSIAEIGGNALQRAGLMETLEKSVVARTRELALLYHIAALSNQIPVFPQMLASALDELMNATEAPAGWIQMVAPDGANLLLAAHAGLNEPLRADLKAKPQGHPFLQRVLAQAEPLLIADLGADPEVPQALRCRQGETYLGAAIRVNRRLLGVVSLLRPSENPFVLDEIALLGAVADQLGIAAEAARLRQEAEQAAVGEERRRLARDLHDSVSQTLFSLNLMSESYRRRIKTARLDEVETWLNELGAAAHQSLKEMRLLVYELRPGIVAQDGLANALRRRLDAVEKRAGIQVNLHAEGDLTLPEGAAFEVYNLLCEALNNSLKHAAARHVEVRLIRREGRFEAAVHDDGCGFDVKLAGKNGGIGLSSMRERAERLGGYLQIESLPGHGAHLCFKMEGHHD